MKTNNYPFLQSFAIATLCEHYNCDYQGTKTVRDMCTSLTDSMSWEGESPDKVYHQFGKMIIADDQLFQVANHYA